MRIFMIKPNISDLLEIFMMTFLFFSSASAVCGFKLQESWKQQPNVKVWP